jgi:ATP-dependent DNA ligase
MARIFVPPLRRTQGRGWYASLHRTDGGILLNERLAEDGPNAFAQACRLGTEGIISKRIDAPY